MGGGSWGCGMQMFAGLCFSKVCPSVANDFGTASFPPIIHRPPPVHSPAFASFVCLIAIVVTLTSWQGGARPPPAGRGCSALFGTWKEFALLDLTKPSGTGDVGRGPGLERPPKCKLRLNCKRKQQTRGKGWWLISGGGGDCFPKPSHSLSSYVACQVPWLYGIWKMPQPSQAVDTIQSSHLEGLALNYPLSNPAFVIQPNGL